EGTEIQSAGGHEQGGIVPDAERPVVADLGAGKVEAQAGRRAWAAVCDFELEQRPGPAAVRRAPAARRELGATDDVGREDREAAATADVLVLTQRGVEVHRLVEGKLVDED